MKILELRFDATIRKAEYESEKIGVTAIVEDGEDAEKALADLRNFVYKGQLTNKVVETVKKVEAKKKVEKVEEPKTEVVVEEVKEEPVKEEKKAKKTKEKFEEYDRMNDIHKKLLSNYLDERFPGWEGDSGLKPKCIAASKMLVGEKFLDKEGSVIPEFKEKVIKLIEA